MICYRYARCHGKTSLVPAIVIAFALAISMLPTLPAGADAQAGTVIIQASEGNATVSYSGWKIFSGDDAQDSKLANIAWTSEAMHTSVVSAIKAFDPGYVDPDNASESAQAAAEFVATHIGDSGGTSSGTFPSKSDTVIASSDSFANTLALRVGDLSADATLAPGEETSLAVGWWLFATEAGSLESSQGTAGTAPVFAHVGQEKVEITEKTSVPTVTKEVLENSNATWGSSADAHKGQAVSYRISGTLPSNLETYDSYYYCFTDTLSKGLSLDESSVRVSCTDEGGEMDVTDAFAKQTSTDEDGATVLTVGIENARDIEGIAASSTLCVTYTAALNSDAVIGIEGNSNEAIVSYSNNPGSDSHGTSIPTKTTTYTWQLSLHKQDKQNAARSLEGAKFTLQVAGENADVAVAGLYVQADGSLGDAAWEFVTDADGNITVPRIDAGSYVLSETVAPESTDGSMYEKISDTTIVVSSNITDVAADTTGDVQLELSAGSSNSDVAIATSVDSTGASQGTGVDVATGTVNAIVRDTKQTAMPKTGEIGAALAIGIGAAALIAGGFLLARRRKSGDSIDAG